MGMKFLYTKLSRTRDLMTITNWQFLQPIHSTWKSSRRTKKNKENDSGIDLRSRNSRSPYLSMS